MSITLQVLHVPDCPNLPPMLERLREVTDLPVTTKPATALPAPADVSLPAASTVSEGGPGRDPVPASEALTAWRARTSPGDPVEKAVHQSILRAFATTGRPPALTTLDSVTSRAGRSTASVLAALHDLDAIRLAPDGQVVVAYPFSATPTRHRVRIRESTYVYAMCAIDALGIAAMLGEDTRIDSADITNGQPVSVSMTAGSTSWDPPGAVVFLSADAGSGPSAECCCDHLNFFTDEPAAQAWTIAHPHILGQILTQTDAETLGARLFGQLLVDG